MGFDPPSLIPHGEGGFITLDADCLVADAKGPERINPQNPHGVALLGPVYRALAAIGVGLEERRLARITGKVK